MVATPTRTALDPFASALERHGQLRFLALGTRRGTRGVSAERTRLLPLFGLVNYAGTRLLSPFHAESLRFRMHPWFDRWVLKQLRPGDHAISSYGYLNACFKFVRRHGGATFIDGGNAHPDQFWEVLTEEHRRWNCPTPPVARHHYERARAMLPEVDYVFTPSQHVRQSFLDRGFEPRRLIPCIYPVDLSCFQPAPSPRPANRPLTLINTGSLSLRKGTPYLLEAFRLVRQRHPTARLQLVRVIQSDVRSVLARYRDLPIDWLPHQGHAQLAETLRQADIFVLPSLEEGLVRTAIEAMACGLPVVLTPACGANDFVQPGRNGEVVPIRDPAAIAGAILKWWDLLQAGQRPLVTDLHHQLSFERFEQQLIGNLRALGFLQETG